jgi:hypothetical protein
MFKRTHLRVEPVVREPPHHPTTPDPNVEHTADVDGLVRPVYRRLVSTTVTLVETEELLQIELLLVPTLVRPARERISSESLRVQAEGV